MQRILRKGLSLQLKGCWNLSMVRNRENMLQKEGITRMHGQIRYDQFYYLNENNEILERMIEKEKEGFKNVKEQVAVKLDEYIKVSESRIDPRSEELPEQYDEYMYYSKVVEKHDRQVDVLYRKRIGENDEQQVFDLFEVPNLSNAYRSSIQLLKMQISSSHGLVGLGIDKRNNEEVEFYFKDMEKNKFMRDRLKNCSDVVFQNDRVVYYVEYDQNWRKCRIRKHIMGENMDDNSKDELILEESDESFSLGINRTKDDKYLIITSTNKNQCEINILDYHSQQIYKLLDRTQNRKMNVDHDNDKFIILRDSEDNKEYQLDVLYDTDYRNNDIKFRNIYRAEEGQIVQDLDVFEGYVVLYISEGGKSLLKVVDSNTREVETVKLAHQVSQIMPGANMMYSQKKVRFHVDTPFEYNLIYEYEIISKTMRQLQECNLLGAKFDKSRYTSYQIEAPSKDGELIPITLVHKKGIRMDRQNKMILKVYGFYGLSNQVEFSIVNLKALENDWIIGHAHVRGGNEKGLGWHDQAIQTNKYKSFEDYIACIQYLIMLGYSHNSLLAGWGCSAGGAIVGQVINSHPGLMKCVCLEMPFVEVLGSLLDRNKALSQSDYVEWGDPFGSVQEYHSIQNLCPYENIRKQNYPAVYCITGEQDFRSPINQVIKYVNKLRNYNEVDYDRTEYLGNIGLKNVFVNVQKGGHYGEIGADQILRERSIMFALFDYLLEEGNNETREQYRQEKKMINPLDD